MKRYFFNNNCTFNAHNLIYDWYMCNISLIIVKQIVCFYVLVREKLKREELKNEQNQLYKPHKMLFKNFLGNSN